MDRLLTEKDIQKAIDDWMAEEYSTRFISRGREATLLIAQDVKTRAITLKEVVEWLDGLCPHRTKVADTSDASRRECGECWEAFIHGEMPGGRA